MAYQTLAVNREGAVLFVEISAPPLNLLTPELVRDLVSLIQEAEADDAEAELDLASMLVDLARGGGSSATEPTPSESP
jgi:hypothetical protein